MPDGTFEVTTKVKIDHTTEGQQAGLLITDPTGQNLVKLAYVQKGAGDGNNKWIEFLKIVGGQYDFCGTWHSAPSQDYPDELWLRYRSDGETLSGWYSTDGVTWQSAGDSRNYSAIQDPQVGFYALRGDAATSPWSPPSSTPSTSCRRTTSSRAMRWTSAAGRRSSTATTRA